MMRRRRLGGGLCEFDTRMHPYVGVVLPDEKGVEWVYYGKVQPLSPVFEMTKEQIKQGYLPVQIRGPAAGKLKLGECGFVIVHPTRIVKLIGQHNVSESLLGRQLGPPSSNALFCNRPQTNPILASFAIAAPNLPHKLLMRYPCTLSEFRF